MESKQSVQCSEAAFIPQLEVEIGKMRLKNPVLVSSGTFGTGIEYADFFDVSRLGAITTKGVSLEPIAGNPLPRLAETPFGMLNCIGLQNPGLDAFCKESLPWLSQLNTNVIVSIPARGKTECEQVITRLNKENTIDAFELNISCPNVGANGLSVGTNPDLAYEFVSFCRSLTDKTLIVKLTPNVTSVQDIAHAVEEAQADAISLINSVQGMAIDIQTRRPKLSNVVGGLSGPAIKPIAVRMVYEVSKAVNIPIIGMGGISNAQDAIEFFIAGASAVSIASANFVNPVASMDVLKGIISYCRANKISSLNELTGSLIV